MRYKHHGKMVLTLLTALSCTLCLAAGAWAMPSVYPTGTTIYDPAKTENGYVLISVDYKNVYSKVDSTGVFTKIPKPDGGAATALDSDEVFLMDMNGNVFNRWKEPGNNKKIYLLKNGNILSINEPHKRVTEYDWSGKVVWEYKTDLGPHHDGRRLENGNTLILCYENLPENNPKVVDVTSPWWGLQERKKLSLRGDAIIEVNPEGKVVWEWKSSEHLQEYLNRYNPLTGMRDWTHGNTVSVIPPNKWYDAGDQRFKPGNILYNPRHFDEFMIIDKDSKKIVWTFTMKTLGGISQCHEPIMIEKGYPGEGNILFFDNALFVRAGLHSGQSAVFEINPSSKEIAWRYFPSYNGSTRFFSKYKGSAYKMMNGNVLISEDYSGRVFQVKPDAAHPDGGAIVWEYMFDSIISRTTMYPYDFTPQLKALPKPKEMKVSPLDPYKFQVLPDELRKGNEVVKVLDLPPPSPADESGVEEPTMKTY